MLEKLSIFIGKLISSFLSLFKILLRSKLAVGQHQTKDDVCIILGNGPSLKTALEDYGGRLAGKNLLCVNRFPDTKAFEQLKPRYFLITSKEYWEPGSIKKHQDIRDNIIKALVEKTSWPLTFFLPVASKNNQTFLTYIRSNSNIDISFFNTTPVEGLKNISHFYMRKGWGMPRPHNVLIPCIFNAVNAGFKEIYILGADHSWLPLISVNDENVALVNQKHFYDEGNTKSESMHRHSRPRRLHEILEKFMLSFKAYFELKDYAETKGVKIYNCTPGSFIDAFERKNIENALTWNKAHGSK